MYFMFLKIIDVTYKDDIFLALESVDITKATYFDAFNLEKVLTGEIAVFKGFFEEAKEIEKQTVVVTAYLDSKEQGRDFLQILREAGVDIDAREILRLLVIPVDMIFDSRMGLKEREG